jgi:alpha-D-ribose 1-methylphosphonate 5-triphosphate synthase subunit PhnI
VTLNLADIDPSSVKLVPNEAGADKYANWSASGYSVILNTRNYQKAISWKVASRENFTEGTAEGLEQNAQQSEFRLDVSDDATGARLVKALSHAVDLCGGKKSAF